MRIFASIGGTSSRLSHTFGRFLVFLALYVQVLLPFFVVADLRIGEPSVGAFPICHLDGSSTPGNSDSSHSAGCCALCLALAVGAPFTAPAEPSLPVRGKAEGIAAELTASVATRYDTAVNYDARAPPLNS